MLTLMSLAVLIAILGLTPPKYGLRQHKDKNYLIICGTLIALIMGFRSQYTGSADTFAYMTMYKGMRSYESFQSYYDLYLQEKDFLFSESGFYYASWLLGRVFRDERVIVVASAILITFSTCFFIYRNSSDAPLSLLMYVCLGLFTFNMNGMRQACAMSICLFAYELAKNRKFLFFLATVVLAMLFHKSAIFFLPVYFVFMIKDSWSNVVIFVVCVMVVILSFDKLLPWFNEATGKEYEYDGGTDTGGISVILIYLFSIGLSFLVDPLKEKELRIPFLMTLTAFTMYMGRFMATEIMERSSYYYYYCTILLAPALINKLSDEERKIMKILLMVAALALFAYRLYVGHFRGFRLDI